MSAVISPPVGGSVQPGFESVRDIFIGNFVRDDGDAELGAAVAVYHKGRCVVDLWGGYADTARRRAWARDTLVNIWSATKGVVALAIAILVDQRRLAYEDTVGQYWPEFAANGKGDITVAQMMSHQAGLNGFTEPTSTADFQDWGLVTTRLAAEKPAWEPGTNASYHAFTYGFLAGELIRRITGQDVGRFVRETISAPLGTELYIGLPDALDWRVAEMAGPSVSPVANPNIQAIASRAVNNPRPDPLSPNQRSWRRMQVPAANGQGMAQSLGRIYGALGNGGVLEGVRLISPGAIDQMREPRHPGPDLLVGPRQWAAGVALGMVPVFGPHAETFGHTGWGGAIGCANVEKQVGIGYVMNRMGSRLIGNARGTDLCAAIFSCID